MVLRSICRGCSRNLIYTFHLQRLPTTNNNQRQSVVFYSFLTHFHNNKQQHTLLLPSPLPLESSTKLLLRNASKKAKSKAKGGTKKIDLSAGEDYIDLKDIADKMEHSIVRLNDVYREKYACTLTPHVLDNIQVTVDGERCRINEVADVTTSTREFVVSCLTASHAKVIAKSIERSLNIVVSVEGDMVKVARSLSTEYKMDLIRPVKESADKSLREVRDTYQTALKLLKKTAVPADTKERIEVQLKLLYEMNNTNTKNILSKKLDELT